MDRRSFRLAAAAVPFALRAGVPFAYVTADTESHVAVVDSVHGIVLHRIPTRPDPRSVQRVGDVVVVTRGHRCASPCSPGSRCVTCSTP